MSKFFRVFYSQVFNSFFPILIIGILIKLGNSSDIASIFLLINYSNIYLLFSDYSSNTVTFKDALQNGGIKMTGISEKIISDITSYIGVKTIILSIGFLIWILLCLTTPILKKNSFTNILAYTFIIGNNLNFYWLYMSSDKEYFFILSNFFSRLFFVLLLIVFINYKIDFTLLMPLVGVVTLIISLLTFIRFLRLYNIPFLLSLDILKKAASTIRRDWPIVANSFMLMTPTTCLSFFIGFVKDSRSILIYAFAEKIFMAVRALLAVFVNSILPIICKEGSTKTRNSKKILLLFYLAVVITCLGLYLVSPIIFGYLKQPLHLNYIFNETLIYFLLTLFIISVNTRFFLNLLVNNNLNKPGNFIYFLFVGALILLVFIIESISSGTVFSIVRSLLIAETLILLLLVFLDNLTSTRST